MKPVLASVLTLLALCACADRSCTGYASRDLRGVAILLDPESDAVVTGTPSCGSPVEFAGNLATAGVTLLELTSYPADTTGIGALLENSPFPILYHSGEPRVALHIEGLNWELRINPGERTTGTALITNRTGETWNADSVKLSASGGILARSSGGVVIPFEGAVIPWWEIDASPPETLLVYGFPTLGRWNAVIAIPMLTQPPPLPGTDAAMIRNDTLWLPADHLVRTDLTWTTRSNGYNCTLDIRSTTGSSIRLRVVLPERLPRGAVTQPGEGFVPSLTLPAGGSLQLRYSEIYQRGA